MGDAEATEVANVLTEGQFAVDGVLWRFRWNEFAVLFNEVLGARFKRCTVVFGPPVGERSIAVETGALVIKAVPDFVADHRADSTEVGRVVAVEVEERWAENRCWERDFVEQRVIVRVDGLRVHEPQFAVDAVLDLLQFALERELRDRGNVTDEIIGRYLERAVVDPFARVTDLGTELLELHERALLGALSHPVQAVDRVPVRLNQAVDEVVHAVFSFRWEVLGYEDLADVFAHTGFDECHATLPAFALFGCSAESMGVEGPVLGHDVLVQIRRAGPHDVEREQLFPCLERLFDELLVESFEEARLPHVYDGPVLFRDPRAVEPVPQQRRKFKQFFAVHLVIACLGVACFHNVPVM